jgi:hypothetical protein
MRMIAFALAASLLLQAPLPLSDKPGEVTVMAGDEGLILKGVVAKQKARDLRFIFMVVSSNWLTLDGMRSAVRFKNASPKFTIAVPPGEDVEDVWLVRLKSKDGIRSVGHSSSLVDPIPQGDRLPMKMEPVEPGSRTYRASPEAPLKPGEYAIVMGGRFFDFGVE